MIKAQNDNTVEALKFALNNQINWQKYAEAKNVILFTFTVTSLASLLPLVKGYDTSLISEINNTFKGIPLSFFIITTFSSLIISSLSITPNLFISKEEKLREFEHIQIINWNYVRKKSFNELIKKSKKYNEQKQIEDILDQHLMGSKITHKKFMLFNIGITIYLIGCLFFFGSITLYLLKQ
jgi:hypothetical protein